MNARQLIAPLRVLSFATAFCFCWSFILASSIHAAVDGPLLPPGQSRVLSSKEMSQIVGSASPIIGTGDGGGSGGGMYTNPAATPGTPYSWEGALGGIKIGNGNKLTSVGIVGWTQRGGMPVDLTLNHNSESSRNGELGPKWLMSYDDTINVDGSGNVTVYWGDGRVYTFTVNMDGSYTPPAGVHDTLVRRNVGSYIRIIDYLITTKDQVVFDFNIAQSGSSVVTGVVTLITITDENGNRTNIGYGASGVQTITDQTGRKITLGYTNRTYAVGVIG